MTLPINLSTGPVAVSDKVMKALSEPPISHRSVAFRQLYEKTTSMLCDLFKVQQTFLVTGSGTLANECMMQEIKHVNGPGIILSNGEFGERLNRQAVRNDINFFPYKLAWGEPFNLSEIEKLMMQSSVQWIMFCHCETSTGVINDLEKLIELCKANNRYCFVDCMSTVGTAQLDLSGVTMATASSGKGLASIPGLGVIFSNRQPFFKTKGSVCLDLAYYEASNGIPFTISSNLLKALYVSIGQKQRESQYALLQTYGEKFYDVLEGYDIVPFSQPQSKVFTIVQGKLTKHQGSFKQFGTKLGLSYESEYLRTRGWQQLAIFGYFTEARLKQVLHCLASAR